MSAYLQICNVAKIFHGVTVIRNINVDINSGEIHVVIGENGAGKSTLMKIIAGLFKQDDGTPIFDGEEVCFQNPQDAISRHFHDLSRVVSGAVSYGGGECFSR